MSIIYFGNSSPINAKVDGNQITTVHSNESDIDATLAVIESLWPSHSNQPPAWVDTENQDLAQKIANTFQCEIGRPKNWENN